METGQPVINETERKIEFVEDAVVPYSELWHTLRRNEELLLKQKDSFDKKQDKFVIKIAECILDLKRSIDKLSREDRSFDTLRERLESLHRSFTDTLKDFNYELKTFDGQLLKKVDKKEIEVAGHSESEEIGESVIMETITPLIRSRSKTLQRAKVFVCIPTKKNQKK